MRICAFVGCDNSIEHRTKRAKYCSDRCRWNATHTLRNGKPRVTVKRTEPAVHKLGGTHLGFHVPPQLKRRLVITAARQGLTQRQLIIKILDAYLPQAKGPAPK